MLILSFALYSQGVIHNTVHRAGEINANRKDVAKNMNAPILYSLKPFKIKVSSQAHTVIISSQFFPSYLSTLKTWMWTVHWSICDVDLLSRLLMATVCVFLLPIKLFPSQPRSCQPVSRVTLWEEPLNLSRACEELKQEKKLNIQKTHWRPWEQMRHVFPLQ